MRFFNTEGPVDCERHYCLPPLERLDMQQGLRRPGQYDDICVVCGVNHQAECGCD